MTCQNLVGWGARAWNLYHNTSLNLCAQSTLLMPLPLPGVPDCPGHEQGKAASLGSPGNSGWGA